MMKKIIAVVVLACAVGAFAHRPSVDVSRQGAVETLWPMDMTRASRELPTEAYDTI